ncbi:hypothetical protein [Beijerinckia indica]|uniref:Uncharacterized protein n=1 Tax=Beijerinckia indica subsp. indica (strain ATCC 9039 / DSM 1715 / NCIMB 8712) TaxID=395963 RepID=B2IH36_BEII9|nr:hypothetical protein [Beijerinckia indica]ACB94450.1 hypothetical protein Bind_0800 [Beijerinckia indica subsp. indica ATCC 9039]
MAVPRTVSEHLADLKSQIKSVDLADHVSFIVAARHCAETFRRYMAVNGTQSLAIDNLVSKCSILVEALKAKPPESQEALRRLRRDALDAADTLTGYLSDAEPAHEARILPLVRR